MTLAERYHDQSLSFLINIIEHQHDYTPEAVNAAINEILRQGHERSSVIAEARKLLSQRIESYLDQFNVVNDKLELPQSHYFNEEEVKLIFMHVFNQWNTKTEDMTPDSWQYILAAGFG